MKKLLGIIIVCLLWFSTANADFEWIKTEKFTSTNTIVNEDKFKQFLNSNLSNKSVYLGMSSNNKKTTLIDNLYKVLEGPPNKIRYLENDRYIVISACRFRSCPEKGFVWIDTKKEIVVGLILHYFFEKEENIDVGYFLIFSKDIEAFDKIPEQFFGPLKEWMIKQAVPLPEKIRFIGTDDSISTVPEKYKIKLKSLPKCEGENVFKWTDCIGAYIISDGDTKPIDFNVGDEKKLTNPSFEEMKNFNFGTKYIGEMKNGNADGTGTMILRTGTKNNFSFSIYKGQFKNGNFNQKGTILKGKHTIKELN